MSETRKSLLVVRYFFFSSRRRHTRSLCDWSSDVCSSDLFSLLFSRIGPPGTGAPGGSAHARISWGTLVDAATAAAALRPAVLKKLRRFSMAGILLHIEDLKFQILNLKFKNLALSLTATRSPAPPPEAERCSRSPGPASCVQQWMFPSAAACPLPGRMRTRSGRASRRREPQDRQSRDCAGLPRSRSAARTPDRRSFASRRMRERPGPNPAGHSSGSGRTPASPYWSPPSAQGGGWKHYSLRGHACARRRALCALPPRPRHRLQSRHSRKTARAEHSYPYSRFRDVQANRPWIARPVGPEKPRDHRAVGGPAP